MEREGIRIPYTASENAPRESRAGVREREEERDQRRDVPAKSDGIRRGRKEEEEGEKRWMLKRGRASGMPTNGWNVR